MEFTAVSTQGLGLTEMISVMAAPQQVYTVPAYTALDTYAPYPQYVTQVAHPAYIAAAAPQAPPPPTFPRPMIQDPTHYERIPSVEDASRSRDRRNHGRDRDRFSRDHDRKDRDRRDHRDRDHRDRDRRDRTRDRDRRSRSKERDQYRDDDQDSSYENMMEDEFPRIPDYKSAPPNSTIMVRGLAQHITEGDIRSDIMSYNLIPKDIRLVRKKDSGASRGFAFVEFTTVDDASKWMEEKQGVLILQEIYRATLQFSIPKESDQLNILSLDWFCVKCSARNFKRRDTCFKCNSSKSDSETTEEICHYMTNMILLQGLDTLSTEESVLEAIQHVGSNLPIRSVRIGRDTLTNTSRGVCYIELNSVTDSMQLFNNFVNDPPVVDGKLASVSYCKVNQSGQNNASQQRNSQQQAVQPMEYTAGADIEKLAEYSASMYAKTPEEHATYVQYYIAYYQQQAEQLSANSTQSDSVNAAAAVAQTALRAVQKKTTPTSTAAHAPVVSQPSQSADTTEYPKYPTPDVSTYTYDESSGYYYDASTGLYYDANSSYYYNAEARIYLYWDAAKSTYIPMDSAAGTEANAPAVPEYQDPANVDNSVKDKREKLDKVKVAKKIAKDMAKWAKSLNKRTENAQKGVTGLVAPPLPPSEVLASQGGLNPDAARGKKVAGSADMAFSMLLEKKHDRSSLGAPGSPLDANLQMHSVPSALMGMKTGLVAAYGDEGSESDEEKDSGGGGVKGTQELVDYEKLACLLCKRQFPTHDALSKHVHLSNLHKTNMEAIKAKGGAQSGAGKGSAESQPYRDRAKERRSKYSQPKKMSAAPKPLIAKTPRSAEPEYSFPAPPVENIGSKLLKKMGWSDGMGLGKTNQGRTSIIEAEMRNPSAGLGAQGASYAVAGDTYKDCVKKMMIHRYQELDNREKNGS